jgi:hypothetical protein
VKGITILKGIVFENHRTTAAKVTGELMETTFSKV